MNLHRILTTLALLALPLTLLHAQERTAGGNLQAEASWNALKAMVERTQNNIDLLKTDVSAIQKCNNDKKLYSKITGKCEDISDPRVQEIINCGNKSMFYSDTKGCIASAVAASDSRWVASTGPSNTPMIGSSSRSGIEAALKSIGISECKKAPAVGQKCSPTGSRCAVVSRADRYCGSHHDYSCTDYTSTIFTCN